MQIMYGNQEVIGMQEYVSGDGINIKGNTISVNIPVEEASLTDEQKDGVLYLVGEPEWVPVSVSIQEYDTEDGWHVRKWSTGYLEAITKFDHVIPASAWGNSTVTSHDPIPIPDCPVQLVEEYGMIVNCVHSGNIWGYAVENNDVGKAVMVASPVVRNNSFEITIIVEYKGRWK